MWERPGRSWGIARQWAGRPELLCPVEGSVGYRKAVSAHHRLHLKFVEKRQHDPIMAYRLERNGAIDVPFQTRTRNTISVDWLNVLKYTNTLLLPYLQGVKERNWYRLPVRLNNFFVSSFYFVSFIIEIPRLDFPDATRALKRNGRTEKEMAIRENYTSTFATDAPTHGWFQDYKGSGIFSYTKNSG